VFCVLHSLRQGAGGGVTLHLAAPAYRTRRSFFTLFCLRALFTVFMTGGAKRDCRISFGSMMGRVHLYIAYNKYKQQRYTMTDQNPPSPSSCMGMRQSEARERAPRH